MLSKLTQRINSLISPLGIRIIRLSTLDHLTSQLQLFHDLPNKLQALTEESKVVKKELVRLMYEKKWECIDHFDTHIPDTFTCVICDAVCKLSECETKVTSCLFNGGKLLRFICPNCGVIFGPLKMLRISAEELAREYRDLYQTHTESNTTEHEIKSFYALNPKIDGIYLNYGSGGAWTQSLTILRNEGWNIFGYEPFSNSYESYVIRDPEQLKQMKFDGIISNNLIEHLQDPIAEFTKMKSLLKDRDSVMVHSTACYEYLYEQTRFHLFFFCGKSLEFLGKKTGLRATLHEKNGDYIAHKFEIENLN